ncbi:alkaline phosphatase [Chloroflexia bacterium SDU3-3]|nr:alkaline phosphatase [Chloroflexia bacterium SDU3-3]
MRAWNHNLAPRLAPALACWLLAACVGEPPRPQALPGAAAATLVPSATPALSTPVPTPSPTPAPPVRIAVIGDYGLSSPPEAAVATQVAGLAPDAVVTTGDNNYPAGGADTIDDNIGQYYHRYIGQYQGAYGPGAAENRFFPVLGNHDWQAPGAQPYLDYFALPGNERYYQVDVGPVRVFALDSMPGEPDGTTADSVQGAWLREGLASSGACWNVVVMHHPPYSSGLHGSSEWMQWPFAAWGADMVLAGHDHSYERLAHDGIPYVVNGLGGGALYDLGPPIAESQVQHDGQYGAMLLEADAHTLRFQFVTVDGAVVDDQTLRGGCGG